MSYFPDEKSINRKYIQDFGANALSKMLIFPEAFYTPFRASSEALY
jgi:hypothetical protein